MRFLVGIWIVLSATAQADSVYEVSAGHRLSAAIEHVNQVRGEQRLSVFWRGSYIRSADDEFAKRKRELVESLSVANVRGSAALAEYIGSLSNYKRHVYTLDYDALRLSISKNPLLDKPVQLVVRDEPKVVVIISEDKIIEQEFVPNTPVASFVKSLVDNDWVYQVSADGSYTRLGIRMFNNSSALVQKGAVIYAPLKGVSDQMNSEVVKILANGVAE